MTWMHPWTFVFILIIVFCMGFSSGVRWCNRQLRGIRDEMMKLADQLERK
jgi:hypothetical protein